MSQAIINTALKVRGMVLHQVNSIPEELFDIQPAAFNNTIRWNVGHIAASLDGLLSKGIPFNSNLPESYKALFTGKSKPSDWTEVPPTKEQLVQFLSNQMNALAEISPEVLMEQLKTPINLGPMTFETVGDIFNFTFIHETMHLTTIKCILQVINQENK